MTGRCIVGRTWRRYCSALPVVAITCAALIASFVADRFSRDERFPRTNYSCIEDGLYLGGILEEPPPGTQTVLNICETKDPYSAEFHRWDPIPDAAPAPNIDWLRQQVEFVDEQRRAGRQVYV